MRIIGSCVMSGGMTKKQDRPARERCRNCGQKLYGNYCAACGQPERDGHPSTFRHFLDDLFHEYLHVDGKIFRTLGALIFQPGRLTEEYWAGRVVSWIRPIRVFLVILSLHVLLSPGEGPLNQRVKVNRSVGEEDLKANIVSGLIDSEAIASYVPWFAREEEGALASEEERERFSREFEKAYAVIRYTSVLLFALLAWLFYHRQQPYFVYHLIGGLHFYSFWYAIAMVAGLPARLNPAWNNLSVVAFPYLFLALGRLFHERRCIQLTKTTALYLFVHLTELGLGYTAAKWIER
jgi:hypothetical protein